MSANLSRRSFIAGSAAMGGMMLGVSSSAEAKVPSKWDFKADVIVVGAGAAGIPAAIQRSRTGLSVLVVDANYDIGGHASFLRAIRFWAAAMPCSKSTALRTLLKRSSRSDGLVSDAPERLCRLPLQ